MDYPIIGTRCPVSESIRAHIRSVPHHINTYEQELAERLSTVTPEDVLDELTGIDAFQSALASGDAETVGMVVLAARKAYAERIAQTWFYGQTNVEVSVECDKALSRAREGKTVTNTTFTALAHIKRIAANASTDVADANRIRSTMAEIASKALIAAKVLKGLS